MIMLGIFPCSEITAKRDSVSSFPTTSAKSVGLYFSSHGNSRACIVEVVAISTVSQRLTQRRFLLRRTNRYFCQDFSSRCWWRKIFSILPSSCFLWKNPMCPIFCMLRFGLLNLVEYKFPKMERQVWVCLFWHVGFAQNLRSENGCIEQFGMISGFLMQQAIRG